MSGKSGRGCGDWSVRLTGGPRELFVKREQGLGVDAEREGPKGNGPLPVRGFRQTEVLADQHFGEKEPRPSPREFAPVADAPHLARRRIVERGQATWEGAQGGG